MESKRKRAKWGYYRGCVGVDDAQRVRDNAEQTFQRRRYSRRGHKRRLCKSFYRRADRASIDVCFSVGWVRFVCDPRARIDRSDAVVSSSFHTSFSLLPFRQTHSLCWRAMPQ